MITAKFNERMKKVLEEYGKVMEGRPPLRDRKELLLFDDKSFYSAHIDIVRGNKHWLN